MKVNVCWCALSCDEGRSEYFGSDHLQWLLKEYLGLSFANNEEYSKFLYEGGSYTFDYDDLVGKCYNVSNRLEFEEMLYVEDNERYTFNRYCKLLERGDTLPFPMPVVIKASSPFYIGGERYEYFLLGGNKRVNLCGKYGLPVVCWLINMGESMS